MTDNNHPITPPTELIQAWLAAPRFTSPPKDGTFVVQKCHSLSNSEIVALATEAARWGADWQLEQVIQFLEANKDFTVDTVLRFIRPMMRPQETRND